MAEKLVENRKPSNAQSHESEPEEEPMKELNQGEAFTLITRSFVAIAASLDTFAFILEKWALKNQIVTEKDLE